MWPMLGSITTLGILSILAILAVAAEVFPKKFSALKSESPLAVISTSLAKALALTVAVSIFFIPLMVERSVSIIGLLTLTFWVFVCKYLCFYMVFIV